MDEPTVRFWTDLVGRLSGPLALRLILQPTTATLYALRDGLKDARSGRPAYFWTIFTDATERRQLLREGWKSISRVVGFAALMDLIYQVVVFREFRPVELGIVVFTLAVLPYLILRGPINRIASHWLHRRPVAH